jgi:hypothetical protein
MPRTHSWILTDTDNDIWLDTFNVDHGSVQIPVKEHWSIRKKTLRGGLRDGIDLLEVENGTLSLSILPTRGMGIWRGDYHGNSLGWKAPVRGPVHPKFVNLDHRSGLGWLTGFDELLCRCGLANNGPPGVDTRPDGSSMPLTLHGRIANQPAHFVEVRIDLEPPHDMSITGHVAEGGLFFPHLHLTSTISTRPGWNRFVVHDVVENRGAQPTEMQMLYHCNLGAPFLGAGSRVIAPFRELAPLTTRATEGIDTYGVFTKPTPGFAEQVYCVLPATDAEGQSIALLQNAAGSRAVQIRWNPEELPCFSLWKNSAGVEDGYVTGLEPGTNFPNPKSFERSKGRVRLLQPGERWECTWSFEVLDCKDEVTRNVAALEDLQAKAKGLLHRMPQKHLSAQG